MQTSDLRPETLRRLSEVRLDTAAVLSLYLDLDPSQFATPPARETAIRSALDEADRRLKNGLELPHDALAALRADLDRVREALPVSGPPAEGAHGLALFCSSAADLFECIRLPRPVPRRVVIDRSPHIEPLATLLDSERWCIALVSRQSGRILRGSGDRLLEVADVHDDVHGQHDQGGWSQGRYQRAVEKEVHDHLNRVSARLLRNFERLRFDHLLLGGPREITPAFEERLHPWVRERLRGRIDVDVDNTSPGDVLEAARPAIGDHDRERERQALDRVKEGVGGGGRGTAGLDDSLAALNERRVEALLLDRRFSAAGVRCLSCGWLGAGEGASACPADGGELETHEDLREAIVELAMAQAADVLSIRHHDDLETLGGIGAALRF